MNNIITDIVCHTPVRLSGVFVGGVFSVHKGKCIISWCMRGCVEVCEHFVEEINRVIVSCLKSHII